LLGNPDEARDVLQEIFIQVDKSLPNFKGESSLYTWVVRLATNVCFNCKRKFDRVNRHTPLDDALPQAVLLPTERPRDNPDAMCRTQFRQYLVEHALQQLPATQRAVVVLCDLEGMTAPKLPRC
jgi:RNA polymerase sigma-70 factor, ECF subfamily